MTTAPWVDWSLTCWYVDGDCPQCGGRMATNGQIVWCEVDACSYTRLPLKRSQTPVGGSGVHPDDDMSEEFDGAGVA